MFNLIYDKIELTTIIVHSIIDKHCEDTVLMLKIYKSIFHIINFPLFLNNNKEKCINTKHNINNNFIILIIKHTINNSFFFICIYILQYIIKFTYNI